MIRATVIGALIGLVFMFGVMVGSLLDPSVKALTDEGPSQMIEHSHPAATEGGEHSHGFVLQCVIIDD